VFEINRDFSTPRSKPDRKTAPNPMFAPLFRCPMTLWQALPYPNYWRNLKFDGRRKPGNPNDSSDDMDTDQKVNNQPSVSTKWS